MNVHMLWQKVREVFIQEWQKETDEKNLPLTDHLEELRYRLIMTFGTIGACFIALYPFSEGLLRIVSAPLKAEQLHMLSPPEAFIVHLKLALFGAIIISVPMTLYQLWAFIAPGLYANEKDYALPFVVVATIFFGIGGYFAYRVILPFGLRFLLGYGGPLVVPMISVSNYVSFVTRIILAFGAVFELPLLVVFLTKLQLITPALMRKYRKYAIILAFVLGAILTPPDVFTQILMAGPLIVLYEMSTWVCVFFSRRQTADPEEEKE